jgi:hypothetical protein
MKYFGILMSSDEPNLNVLKIKLAIIFTIENTKEELFYLQIVIMKTL